MKGSCLYPKFEVIVKLCGSGHAKIPVPVQSVSGSMICPPPLTYPPNSSIQSASYCGSASSASCSSWRGVKPYASAISAAVLCDTLIFSIVSDTVTHSVTSLPSSSVMMISSSCSTVRVLWLIWCISDRTARSCSSCPSSSATICWPYSSAAMSAANTARISSQWMDTEPSSDIYSTWSCGISASISLSFW